MRPWCIHCLAEKETQKRTKFNGKNTASSSQQYYFLGYLVFFFKEPADKKKTKIGEKTGEAATVVPGIRVASRTLWTTTNKLEAGPAANKRPRQRGTDASFTCMCASSVLSRRATSPAPAQRKHCRYFSTLYPDGDRPDGTTKKRISYEVFRGSPDDGGILTSSKQTEKKYVFFAL